MSKKVITISVSILLIAIIIFAIFNVINNNKSSDTIINNSNITISVEDQSGSNLFRKSINTDKEYLIDVLNDINELEVKTVDSEYGAYITSILGIEQSDNYYWAFYIDDNYSTVGVSSYKIKSGETYRFKYEEIIY